jgi:hypothetical protein
MFHLSGQNWHITVIWKAMQWYKSTCAGLTLQMQALILPTPARTATTTGLSQRSIARFCHFSSMYMFA